MTPKLKLVEARIYLVSIAERHPVLVQLRTSEGISGVGEAATAYGSGATAAAGMIKDLAEQFLPDQDPFHIEAIWSEIYDHSFWAKGGGAIIFAGMSAIEQALWDIKGKALGVPVYEMLGGKMIDEARVYANGWSFRCVTPADFAREAERVVKDGYTALKFYPLATAALDAAGHIRHVSRRTISREFENVAVDRVKAVRGAVGPRIDLLVDVSAELTTDTIVRVARRLEEFDVFCLEEPVDPFDSKALKSVAEQTRIPLAVGERVYARYGFRRILELGAAAYVQPDVGNTGGIMEAKKIAAMAEAYSVRILPHNCASPVATAAALQLDACLPNFVIQEIYPYRVPEHFQIVDRAPELSVHQGFIPIPDGPGLGVELVEEHMRPFLWHQCKL